MGFFEKSNEEVVDRVLRDFGDVNGVGMWWMVILV